MERARLALLSIAAGLTVANLYYAQPLAATMAQALAVTAARMGTALTATQVGYAAGMVLLVPLGDGRERRAVIVATTLATIPALLLVAAARSVPQLAVASLLLGAASSVPQLILPYAVDLFGAEERGRVVGTVMSGLLCGILLSRTASGMFAAVVGWRTVFLTAAGAMLVLAGVLRRALPTQEPPERIAYPTILRSLVTIAATEPVLVRRSLVGAGGMASFSVFWAMLSFHLASLGYGSAVAGGFGAIGVAGVVVAPIAGRLATRVNPTWINVASLLLAALAFAGMGAFGRSLPAIAAGVVFLDAGVQASHLANQTVVFGLRPQLRSRMNAIYMVSYFVGGGVGSGVGALAWAWARWPGVCAAGAAFALLALAPLVGRKA